MAGVGVGAAGSAAPWRVPHRSFGTRGRSEAVARTPDRDWYPRLPGRLRLRETQHEAGRRLAPRRRRRLLCPPRASPRTRALVSVYGLLADPNDIRRNVDDVLAAAPTEVQDLVRSQLSDVVESSRSGLRLGALVGIALALWSASSGVKNLMTAGLVAHVGSSGFIAAVRVARLALTHAVYHRSARPLARG